MSASLNHPNKGGRNVKCVVVVDEPSAITFLKQWLMYPKLANWFNKNMANGDDSPAQGKELGVTAGKFRLAMCEPWMPTVLPR